MAHPAAAVFEYHLAGYRRVWLSTIASSLAMPAVFFLGMGLAVGAYVDRGRALPVPYLHYIAPGMIAFAALQTAVSEAGFPVMTHFRWQKIYENMAAAPLRVPDMIFGRLGYIALRVTVTTSAFVAIMLAFGTVRSWWTVTVFALAALTGLAIAAPMFAFAATVRSPNLMAVVVRVGLLPMMLFSGVFFPVGQLPGALRPVAYVLPLWNGVELCRAATSGVASAWPWIAHCAVLGAWLVAGFVLARHFFVKRLAV